MEVSCRGREGYGRNLGRWPGLRRCWRVLCSGLEVSLVVESGSIGISHVSMCGVRHREVSHYGGGRCSVLRRCQV